MLRSQDHSIRHPIDSLDATYTITSSLGEGNFGSVSKVYDEHGQIAAVKLFNSETEEEDGDEKQIGPNKSDRWPGVMDLCTMREISVLSILTPLAHPGIIPMQQFGRIHDHYAMIMPIVSSNLHKAIKFNQLSNPMKLMVTHQMLCTLGFLQFHRILHRDIKPENILLEYESDAESIHTVLADFGLATIHDESIPMSDKQSQRCTHTPNIGTCVYKAPEVYRYEPYGFAADVYSLGVCLLEMFQGRIRMDRDKAGFEAVEDIRRKLNRDKPLPDLLFQLLDPRQECRIGILDALRHRVFSGFLFPTFPEHPLTFRVQVIVYPPLTPIQREIGKLMRQLHFLLDITMVTAEWYYRMTQCPLFHCVLLAGRLYEAELLRIDCIRSEPRFELSAYLQSEAMILRTCNYCLFLRDT